MQMKSPDGGEEIPFPAKPCPFCGSGRLAYYDDAEAVGCRDCFMTGPIISSNDNAIERAETFGDLVAAVYVWNIRKQKEDAHEPAV
jgi:hypothetical protein